MAIPIASHSTYGVSAFQELLALAVGDEDRGIGHLHSMLARETRGALGCEQDVAPVLHDRNRQIDGMPDVAKARGGPDPQLCALHHPGVELDHSVAVEAGADPCVQQRLVFHVPHSSHGGRQCAFADGGPPGVTGAVDRGMAVGPF